MFSTILGPLLPDAGIFCQSRLFQLGGLILLACNHMDLIVQMFLCGLFLLFEKALFCDVDGVFVALDVTPVRLL
jgi:hypothetical protein